MQKAKCRGINEQQFTKGEDSTHFTNGRGDITDPLMIKNTRTNDCVERIITKWQRADISLLNVVESTLTAQCDCFGRKIEADSPAWVTQALRDCTCPIRESLCYANRAIQLPAFGKSVGARPGTTNASLRRGTLFGIPESARLRPRNLRRNPDSSHVGGFVQARARTLCFGA